MFKSRKEFLSYSLIAIILISSGVYIERVRSNGQNPTWDELLGMFNVPWFNASTGINAPKYVLDDVDVTDILEYPVEPASYIIFNSSNVVWAKSGLTGKINYGGAWDRGGIDGENASAVIESTMNDLTDGGLILIKQGEYTINTRLLIPYDGIILQGEGHGVSIQHGVTILKQGNNKNLADIINTNGKTNVHIRDLFIDGNKNNNDGSTIGIVFTSEDGSIENTGVMYCDGHGISINTHAAYFKQIFSEDNSGAGFKIDDSWGCVFEDCYAAAGNANISFYILGNTHHCTFIGCVAQDDTNDGFTLQSFGGNVEYLTFIGCQVFQQSFTMGQNGFELLGVQHSIFIGCQITNMGQSTTNTYDGFYLASQDGRHSTNNTIKGCHIVSTTTNRLRYGINEVDANQDYNLFEGNTIAGMATGGIDIQGANSKAMSNIGFITENGGTQTCADNENIAHELAGLPTMVQLTSLNATYDGVPVISNVDWTGVDETNINVALYWVNGTAITTDIILVSWRAEYNP